MVMATKKIGGYMNTKILHANHEQRNEEKNILRKVAQNAIGEAYFEDDPSVAEWCRDLVPTAAGVHNYFQNLFPSASWLRRYNTHWLLGDAIAGKYQVGCLSNYE